ncbi:MAG TPA: bifunctional demethylmenaquinone methyltransferase/2-methoxy-6-polyprenyl-1,4-benzoquinol methylase UbiE [Bacteroidia bacterium]|nr:bifunctional demethylmenaquinone methyltransferase/2-methoxy-6-polyprenyl-1,4-benzoquinol methylase UbiE [Bacteroidia bacterium]HNT79736.1 bifunctional demethylmenaquinone methyltransferase/2-methoxy-6-polyprenyl-1,4-benzoquinol methylase UbiE [Bacteroidia bacterium]
MENIKPYQSTRSKKEEVREMFDNISPKYDFLNHLLSAGIDSRWRKRVVKEIQHEKPKVILDAATGTGDLAFALLKLQPLRIEAIDISEGMLKQGITKKKKQDQDDIISFSIADCENLPYSVEEFDAITIAFGVRNFQHLEKGIKEFSRVLKNNGTLAVLEFSKPKNKVFNFFYQKYNKYILPIVGKMVSKDKRAYTYLPESVEAFPSGKAFENIITRNGFSSVKTIPLSFGIANLYLCRK